MTAIMTGGRIADYSVLVISGGELDGTQAEALRLTPLFRELERMGVSGINATMGKNDLLAVFHRAVETVADRKLRPAGSRPMPLSQIVARQAAALLAAGHAGRGGTLESGGTERALQNPIATTSTRGA